MIDRMKHVYCASVILFSLATTAEAGVIRYEFSQDGFDQGAILTGYFVGEDTSGDGQLGYFPGGPAGFDEVIDFGAQFSGNALVPAFVASLDDVFGLVYDINLGPVIGDGITGAVEGIGVTLVANGTQYTTGSGPGPFPGGQIVSVTGAITTTPNNAVVTRASPVVPEPTSLAAWGIFVIASLSSRRRPRSL